MIRKRFSLLCLALALVLLCCACGAAGSEPTPAATPEPTEAIPEKETPAQICEKMEAALKETPCTKAQIVMDMGLTVDAGEDGTFEVNTATTSDIVICLEPVSSYSKVTVDTESDGEKNQTVSETYIVVEDGELVSYVNTNGIWLKLPIGQTAEEYIQSASNITVDSSTAAVDESVTEWNGKKAICLTTQIKGSELEEIIGTTLGGIGTDGGALGEAADLIGSADYSALTCDARLYIDPETYLPIAEEMAFDGMTDVLAPVYEQMGLTAEVNVYSSVCSYDSYEAQAEITLPEGVSENAEAWTRLLSDEPDNGDGTFTIREGLVLADIVTPEGFTLNEKDYDHVYFTRDDHRFIGYTIYYLSGDDQTGAEFTAMVDSTVARYEAGGGKVGRETTTLSGEYLSFYCDILGMTWGSGREDAEIYAWTPLAADEAGVYYLLVEVSDGYSDGLGGSKSADLTFDEFIEYLNGAALGKLMG